jgi:MTH538 TIR-like domain (DUF1863)
MMGHPMPRNSYLYVSHSWSNGVDREKLLRILSADTEVVTPYDYCGVDKDDPIHAAPDYELRAEMRRQMLPVHVVIVNAGQYERMARWVDEEVDLARGGFSHRRRVVTVVPFAAEKQAQRLAGRVDKLVPWVAKDICAAVRELCATPLEPVISHQHAAPTLKAGITTNSPTFGAPSAAIAPTGLRRAAPAATSAAPTTGLLRRPSFGTRNVGPAV